MTASRHNAKTIRTGTLLLAALLTLVAHVASAQLTTPLHIGNTNAIANEFGAILPGNAEQPGAFVQLLWTTNNTIYPPDTTGQPDPRNTPLTNGTTAIGRSTAPWLPDTGLFSLSLASPRPTSGKLFVRVFNKPTIEESSFYADSQIFTINGNQKFIAHVGPTTNALDTADDDNDGLHNSWEKSYGSDPNNPDTDGDGITDGDEHALGLHPALADTDHDGMNDGHELRAGTDPTDPTSYLGLAALIPQSNNLQVTWATIPGRAYQIEAAPGLLNTTFSNLTGTIPAAPGTHTTTTLTNALSNPQPLIIRVRLVEE